jgi:hypothetical protein
LLRLKGKQHLGVGHQRIGDKNIDWDQCARQKYEQCSAIPDELKLLINFAIC